MVAIDLAASLKAAFKFVIARKFLFRSRTHAALRTF